DAAGQHRDESAEIGEDVVDREDLLVDRSLLHYRAVQVGADGRPAYVDAAHDAGPDRTEAIHPLHAQHRAGVGIAIVVAADVVRGREAGDVVPRLFTSDVAHRLPDDHRDLALVVEVLVCRGPPERAAMGIQRRRGFLEVGRRLERWRLELDAARLVVQMDADDLRRIARRQVDRGRFLHAPAVPEHQLVAVRRDPAGHALVVDAPELPTRTVEHAHRAPPRGSVLPPTTVN